MARVLVHYDIADEEFRTEFQQKITSSNFQQEFRQETESVYVAEFNTTDNNLQALESALKKAASKAPLGTRIFMEHPTAYSSRPEIQQTVIVGGVE